MDESFEAALAAFRARPGTGDWADRDLAAYLAGTRAYMGDGPGPPYPGPEVADAARRAAAERGGHVPMDPYARAVRGALRDLLAATSAGDAGRTADAARTLCALDPANVDLWGGLARDVRAAAGAPWGEIAPGPAPGEARPGAGTCP